MVFLLYLQHIEWRGTILAELTFHLCPYLSYIRIIFPAMKRAIIYTFIMILTVSILISCNNSNDNNGTVRSIYYWSTTMRMDSTKEKFIHDHAISRMYLRYFDVVDDQGGISQIGHKVDDGLPDEVLLLVVGEEVVLAQQPVHLQSGVEA